MVCQNISASVYTESRTVAHLALSEDLEDGLLDVGGLAVETHVSQHHDGAKKKRGGVGELLASNVGRRTVDSLEDGALVTNVPGRSKTKTTNETSAHVGENVSVQVGHDQHLVVVGNGVGDHLQARVVQQLSVELDVGELLGDLAGGAQEEPVGHLHDGGLVHGADLLPANVAGVLEGVSQDALRGLAGDELDALHDTIDHNVLNTRVFSLSVLSDQDRVHVVVGCLIAGNRPAGTDVGEEIEGSAERQVEGNVTLADGRRERALEGDQVLCDAGDGLVGDDRLAVLVQARGDIDRLPLDGDVGGRVDVLDRLRDLGSDTVTLDQRDRVLAVAALGSRELGDLGGVCSGGDLLRYQCSSCLFLPQSILSSIGDSLSHWRRLTCDSAGANLDERLAWRRHCRAGAAKERAANMFEGMNVFRLPNWSYTSGVATCRGGSRRRDVAQSSVTEKASSGGRGHAKPVPSSSVIVVSPTHSPVRYKETS
jgi:hypothetical protein